MVDRGLRRSEGLEYRSGQFLLEDYIPERLDFTLHPAKPVINPGEPIELSLDARFLYGAPASGLDVTGAIRLQVVEGGALAGYPGYVGGLADDEFTTIESQFTDKVQTDAKGHADLSIDLPDGSSTRPPRPSSSSTSQSRAAARSSARQSCRSGRKAQPSA